MTNDTHTYSSFNFTVIIFGYCLCCFEMIHILWNLTSSKKKKIMVRIQTLIRFNVLFFFWQLQWTFCEHVCEYVNWLLIDDHTKNFYLFEPWKWWFLLCLLQTKMKHWHFWYSLHLLNCATTMTATVLFQLCCFDQQ